MFNKIFFTLLAAMGLLALSAQEVTVSIENSSNGCGLSSDCATNFVCFDIRMAVDQTKSLDSYNIWVSYDNTVLSRVNGGDDASCLIGDGGDTDLEGAIGAYRVGGTPVAPAPVLTAGTDTIVHTICFSIIDTTAYNGTIISVGGDKFGGALRTTVTFSDATFDDTVAEDSLTLTNLTAPCLENNPPIIAQPPIFIPEDSTITFCPTISDPNGADILTISSCGGPVNGTFTLDTNCITYTPNLNYNGLDSMCLLVCDNGVPVLCDTTIVIITVLPVNDPPVAVNDTTSTPEDTPVLIFVPGNDSDPLDPLGNIDVTTVATLTVPLNGTTSTDPVTGEVTYTPNLGFNGVDSFAYAICDDGFPLPSLCDTAMVYVTIAAVNDTPTIIQPPVVLPEDSTITFCPAVSDPDAGDILTISSCGGPVNGTFTLDTNCITYTPNLNYNGLDSMCLVVCDNGIPVLCDTTIVIITVLPVNDPPEAVNDTTSTPEDTPVLIFVPGNDSDPLDPLGNIDVTTVATLTVPLNGTTSTDPVTGEVTYTPNLGFNGVDSFAYAICDDGFPLPSLCDTAMVYVTIAAVNDTPTIIQPPVVLPEDSTITFCPTVSDPDAGDILTISSCDGPVNGTFTIDTNCITYTPNANYNGLDSMCLVVCDNGIPVLCDTTIVIITVLPVNDPPEAVNDTTSTPEDTPVVIAVPNNDSDPLDPLGNIDVTTVTTLTVPLNGTTSTDPVTGEVTYTPNLGFNGVDSFAYAICDDGFPLPSLCDTAMVYITIAAVNDTPTIIQPPVVLPEDSTITFCPTVSDPDAGDILTISSCDGPVNGTFTIDTNCITYTPNANYNGLDSMCLVVCDNGIPVLCDTTIVIITVLPVNDPPEAVNDTTSTPEDTPVVIAVPNNDSDPLDPLGNIDVTTVATLTVPLNGTTSTDPVTGAVTYTPNLGFNGVDSFAYAICDDGFPLPSLCDTAMVYVNVGAVNDTPTIIQPPVVLPEDSTITFCPTISDPDVLDVLTISSCVGPVNGTASIDTNCVTYIPNANYNGLDSMCLVVCDNGIPVLCDTTIVIITVLPVNDPPVAVNDTTSTPEDTPVVIAVPNNDSDPLDPLGNIDVTTVTTTSVPLNGTTSTDPLTGEVTYTPNLGFNGVDSFSYVICDDGFPLPSLCDSAMVYVTITAVNDTPTITQPPIVIPEDSTITFCPTISDPDVGDSLTISSCEDPVNGTAVIVNNCVTYTPNLNYNGLDSMCLVVCDDGNPILCDTIIVPITVTPVNDTPSISQPPVVTPEDSTITFCPTISDPDIGDSLTITSCEGPVNGTAVIVNNCIIYTPNLNYNGLDSMCLVVCDDGTPILCDTVVVPITVVPVNDPPTIVQPPVVTPEDSSVVFCPTISDPNVGDSLSITVCGDPVNGTAVLANNCITYTPNANYNGLDSMCLLVCDDGNPILCDTVIVPITVLPVNDPPTIIQPPVVTPEDSTIVFCPTIDDPDTGDSLTITICEDPVNGTVIIVDNCVEYTPNPGFSGLDSLCLVVCDDGLPVLCDTVTVPITVVPGNIEAVNDTLTITTTDPVNIEVLANDLVNTDPVVSVVTPATNGILTVNDDGTITYVPDNLNQPIDSFTYSICIGSDCDTALVIIYAEIPPKEFNLPNAFSPNGDGVNDILIIKDLFDYPEASLNIYNRWGDEVWNSGGPYMQDWNGVNFSNEKLPDGAYYYVIDLKVENLDKLVGFIELHR